MFLAAKMAKDIISPAPGAEKLGENVPFPVNFSNCLLGTHTNVHLKKAPETQETEGEATP